MHAKPPLEGAPAYDITHQKLLQTLPNIDVNFQFTDHLIVIKKLSQAENNVYMLQRLIFA